MRNLFKLSLCDIFFPFALDKYIVFAKKVDEFKTVHKTYSIWLGAQTVCIFPNNGAATDWTTSDWTTVKNGNSCAALIFTSLMHQEAYTNLSTQKT